jgi:hypothetical protein
MKLVETVSQVAQVLLPAVMMLPSGSL